MLVCDQHLQNPHGTGRQRGTDRARAGWSVGCCQMCSLLVYIFRPLHATVNSFGEDKRIDALIRKFGYRTSPEIMKHLESSRVGRRVCTVVEW